MVEEGKKYLFRRRDKNWNSWLKGTEELPDNEKLENGYSLCSYTIKYFLCSEKQ